LIELPEDNFGLHLGLHFHGVRVGIGVTSFESLLCCCGNS
jgi:hypothetical protein